MEKKDALAPETASGAKKTFQKKLRISGRMIDLMKCTADHYEALYAQIKSPGVLENLTIEVESPEDFRRYILFCQNQWGLNQDFTYSIIHYAGAVIGQMSLYNISFLHRRAELGIWLGNSYWKQGIGTEVIKIISHYGFVDLQLNRLQAHIFLTNTASLKLFERVGFQREGIKRQYVRKGDQFRDVYCYSLLRSDSASNSLIKTN